MMRSIVTRFRAYQLGCCGSSFSYFANGHFTVIEARLTDVSRRSLKIEMERCGVLGADALHITSWDTDHCSCTELEELLDLIRPSLIECPGYTPGSDSAKECLKIIESYRNNKRVNKPVNVRHITPEYISSLGTAEQFAFRDTIFNPKHIDPECANNNSTVQHFRKGSFNVLSLGDVEDPAIGARLRRSTELGRETDVMILAHHGADNGFTTKKFVRHVDPQIAICSSNFKNQYDHPRQEIRDLLHEERVPLFTTKTGDVIIKSIGNHTGQFRVVNLIAGSSIVSRSKDFTSRKSRILSYNTDTIRQIARGRPSYRSLV